MERKARYKVYISCNSVNKKKSTNPLVRLKYRELQELAVKLMLPANVKYKILLALIIARTNNREDIVEIIIQDLEQGKKYKSREHRREENRPSEPNKQENRFEDKAQSENATSTLSEYFSYESKLPQDFTLTESESGHISPQPAGNEDISHNTENCVGLYGDGVENENSLIYDALQEFI